MNKTYKINNNKSNIIWKEYNHIVRYLSMFFEINFLFQDVYSQAPPPLHSALLNDSTFAARPHFTTSVNSLWPLTLRITDSHPTSFGPPPSPIASPIKDKQVITSFSLIQFSNICVYAMI
ncbi:hypothetical protein RYX36_029755 [Vicia faba]